MDTFPTSLVAPSVLKCGDSRLDSKLNIVKKMDDFLLYGRNLKADVEIVVYLGILVPSRILCWQ